ncbi:polysaccharide deacetylase family protein [Haloarcula salinisoli]|uniref:Polysaccharide deacetylase family protein n=1 Tax=Haloarcula salinisoli TaxID=2487746 RepID=A0A8J7YH38_9EURY|nr:polysaccharide deacetylase family protein [Halomicroarcula salinisoli]MBX0288245.1 polysaccharide deacetylase family protein [Halomicroarcula salinisoli]MBX0305407.1 polysaccharide deacetylase family protein [Halomicroarcula salinisoli]
MYHYVRGETPRPPSGYYHLDIGDFRAQLDYLRDEFTMLSEATFRRCLRGEQSPPTDGIVLTFDDGLADHHEWVLPELRERGLWGVFFVPTAPLVYGRRLPVQRIHSLVSEYPGPELLDALDEILEAADIDLLGDVRSMYEGRDTADSVRQFKHLLNRAVPDHSVSGVLDRLEGQFPAAQTDVSELYLSASQLRDLSEAGMTIGAHTVTHPVLSDLPTAAQRWEIRASRRQLSALLGEPVDLFAYPYGGAESYTDRTVELVSDAGFTGAFTTVDGDADATEFRETPLTLSRRDCANVEHGDATFSLP